LRKKSLYRLALEWYLAQFDVPFTQGMLDHKEQTGGNKSPPHFRISEYQKLHFFWEELGLNILDLEQVEQSYPGWSDQVLSIGSARSQAMDMKTEAGAASKPQAPIAARGLGGSGKQVITRKLL